MISEEDQPEQLDLLNFGAQLSEERAINRERAASRAFVVLATDPAVEVESSGYRRCYATQARTTAEAMRKVRPHAGERRLRAYLATGQYHEEFLTADWIE